MFQKQYKFNSVQVLIICITALFILSACQSDVNDYWKMEDPTMYINKSSNEKIELSVDPKPFSGEIKYIGYGSFLDFKDISSDVKFDITSTCKRNSTVHERKSTNQKISRQLFFYNYLPFEVLAEKTDEPNIRLFKCNYKITALNKVNSKLNYEFKNLNVSTVTPHKIKLKQTGIKNFTIFENGYSETLIVDFTEDRIDAAVALIDEDFHVMKSTFVICDGEHHKKEDDVYSLRDLPLESFFKKETFSLNYFVKKCRVLSHAKHLPVNESGHIASEDSQLVWSPYFDVILRKPILSAHIEVMDNKHLYHTNNTESYNFKFAKLRIKNIGSASAIVKLNSAPFNTKVDVLSDIVLFGSAFLRPQNSPLHPQTITHNSLKNIKLPSSFLKNSIITEARITTDFNGFIDLGSGDEIEAEIEVSKNFSCSFNGKREIGFWFSGITPRSQEDEIQVYVRNGDKMERFPLKYYISDALATDSIFSYDGRRDNVIEMPVVPKANATTFDGNDVYERKLRQALRITKESDLLGYRASLRSIGSSNKYCRQYGVNY